MTSCLFQYFTEETKFVYCQVKFIYCNISGISRSRFTIPNTDGQSPLDLCSDPALLKILEKCELIQNGVCVENTRGVCMLSPLSYYITCHRLRVMPLNPMGMACKSLISASYQMTDSLIHYSP